MLREEMNGFCMALADSVPGVSGGTVAFIMGFYDRFIGAIHNIAFGGLKEKRKALTYLVKLGLGWAVGMILAVIVLSSLFDSHIYTVSSLFIGFIAGSIPLIIREEKKSFREFGKGIWFCILGIALVTGITWFSTRTGVSSMNLGSFSIGLGIRLFLIGLAAISAMFLPGISGSTLLLIFGAYIPVITAVRKVMRLDLTYIPSLGLFVLGILTGAVLIVKLIKVCLERFRPQTVYLILGMMIGSFYAIITGPTTLAVPRPAMNLESFQIVACLAGLALVIGMQLVKETQTQHIKEV